MISLITCQHVVSQGNQVIIPANNFISSLSAAQKAKTIYKLDEEERYNWHFFPKSNRKGISLNELTEEQKQKAFGLLKSCLSEAGYAKTIEVMQLEGVLKVLENQPNDEYRNSGKYYITIFGSPDQKSGWSWRFEGHHVSFNFSAIENKLISSTPGFLGANPAIVPSGPQKGKQVLKEETESGFTLVQSLSGEQLEKAVIKSVVPNEIITFVSRKASIESNEGLSYSAMNQTQKNLFLKLVSTYVHRYTKLFAEEMMSDLKTAGLDNLRFVWVGAQLPEGKAYYYRIQGPTVIIEFDNSQGNANHIHSVVRDLKNDFGGDELLKHYQKNHQP